jgi:hypothetical protein
MGENTNPLDREEVRGIFVLGVIGSLIALDSFLHNHMIVGDVSWHTVTIALVFYWGAYVFLMAIGVSGEDIVNARFAAHCKVLAAMGFVFGIGTMFAIPLAMLFYWFILPLNLSKDISHVAVILVQIVISTVLFLKLSSEELKQAIRESGQDLFPSR